MPTVKAEVAGKVLTLLGYDGSDFYNVLVDAAGHVQIDVVTTGLPAGAATEAKQDDVIAELVLLQELRGALLSIDVDRLEVDVRSSTLPAGAATEATLATRATDAKLELCRLLLVSLDTELGLHARQTETQPVSAAALPLPAGAASAAAQASLLTELQLHARQTETQPVSAAALPLPAGAATSARQDTLSGKIDALPDLVYQGEHAAGAKGAANVAHNTWTNLATYTVPAGKVFTPTLWMVGIQLANTVFESQLSVGGVTILAAFAANAPASVVGVGLDKATAGQTVIAQGKQVTGGAVWMNGTVRGILIDA